MPHWRLSLPRYGVCVQESLFRSRSSLPPITSESDALAEARTLAAKLHADGKKTKQTRSTCIFLLRWRMHLLCFPSYRTRPKHPNSWTISGPSPGGGSAGGGFEAEVHDVLHRPSGFLSHFLVHGLSHLDFGFARRHHGAFLQGGAHEREASHPV